MNKLLSKLLGVYDTLSTPKKLHFFEVAILKVSIISFVAHIAFIFFESSIVLLLMSPNSGVDFGANIKGIYLSS